MPGTLEQMLKAGYEEASYGSRFHAKLNGTSCAEISKCINRDDWTCHICKVRIPEFMEIDHRVHKPACSVSELQMICPFCHNLKHPIWASLRGRLRIFWLPDIPQKMVNRMAWTVFFSTSRDALPEFHQSAGRIIDRVNRREAILAFLLGSSDPEGFFESLLTARRFGEEYSFWKKVRMLDRFVRFWPKAVTGTDAKLDRPSASLSYWLEGNFIDLASAAKVQFWQEENHLEYLGNLCNFKPTVFEKLHEAEECIDE